SSLIVIVALANPFSIREYLEANVRQELLYMLLIFLLLLPVLMLVLAISLHVENKKGKEPEIINVNEVLYKDTEADNDTTEAEALKELEDEGSGRFCKLCNLDQMKGSIGSGSYDEYITLRQFCENFRNYAASKLKLYYDISDIRRFVSGMAVSKILILQGMSGTGKTSLAHAFGDFVDNPSTVIPVQPMWKERTDLIGYYNEFTKRFNETTLLEKMYEANYSNDIYVTVMDEMNIARVEYYFAEFLSLLELPNAEERLLTVVSDVWEDDPVQLENGCIKLPPNMWFVGTANNDDSTFAISDKVYDRAMIMNLDMKAEPFVAPRTSNTRISAKQFEELAETAMREYEVSARNLHRIEELDKYLIEHFQITFGNRIMKQIKSYIPVYVACGGDELEALDDILSKKVLRKLEMQNPIYLRSASAGLSAYLDELFGYDRMPLCKAFMARLQRTI
ncbi:MAG: AAA family ATPase, partial [Clostridia bacterium]|nr:AAA family ATPase [Clostridia bacterium]